MKKMISILLAMLMIVSFTLFFTGCGGDDDCFICGGSGYYQKKACPGC